MSGIFEEMVEYGIGGFDASKPNNNEIRRTTFEVPLSQANERAIYAKARLALQANATYLALANPTAAQNTAQVKRLTREMNGFIRLLLSELQDVSDT
jgi:hypothetical protein